MDEMLVFLGLGLSPYVDFSLAILTLLGYMLMTVLAYITTIVSGVFRIAYISLGPRNACDCNPCAIPHYLFHWESIGQTSNHWGCGVIQYLCRVYCSFAFWWVHCDYVPESSRTFQDR